VSIEFESLQAELFPEAGLGENGNVATNIKSGRIAQIANQFLIVKFDQTIVPHTKVGMISTEMERKRAIEIGIGIGIEIGNHRINEFNRWGNGNRLQQIALFK
jgi:hypothetical protein